MNNAMSKGKGCIPESMQQKFNILALHGYRQNAEAFSHRTGAFRKMVHKWTNIKYINAPHPIQVIDDTKLTDNVEKNTEEQYGWFFNSDDRTFSGIRKGGPAIGFEESIEYVERVFNEEGPFNGILGFSQGACFLGLLCWLQQQGQTTCKFDFAILASGFKSGSLVHYKYYNELITIPSLHIFGESDEIIPSEMSEELSTAFKSPVIVEHSGGHYVPASAAQKSKYQNFFKLMKLHLDEQVADLERELTQDVDEEESKV